MTAKSAIDFDNMAKEIRWAPAPKRPILNREDFKSNKEYHLALAEAEDKYEADKLEVKKLRDAYGEAHRELNKKFFEWAFNSEDATNLPENVRVLVMDYAYEEGHSGGYSEIYNVFLNIIDIAKAAFEAGVEHEKAKGT